MGFTPKVMESFLSEPQLFRPSHPLPTGSEEGLSYTLSPHLESGCHLHHAWTQTESSHSSWEPEMVRRWIWERQAVYLGKPDGSGHHRKVKSCKKPQSPGWEGRGLVYPGVLSVTGVKH